jgi:hypothetical protein
VALENQRDADALRLTVADDELPAALNGLRASISWNRLNEFYDAPTRIERSV